MFDILIIPQAHWIKRNENQLHIADYCLAAD